MIEPRLEIGILHTAACLVCEYCRYGGPFKDAPLRPYKADEAGNYEHKVACFCKAYKIWQYIEQLESKYSERPGR